MRDDVVLLSVVVLTFQEEKNLPHLIESMRRLNAELFVIDSGSTDRTVEIARAASAHVVEHPFQSQAAQLNWALGALPIRTEWVMRMDADERFSSELVTELSHTLPLVSPKTTGLMVKRRVYFWGRWIRHGGYYPTWLLRAWRRGKAISEQRWMDEHMVLSDGETAKLNHDIIDENQKGLSFWIDKHNRYADREINDMIAIDELHVRLIGQAGRKRWMKKNLYGRLPLFLRPVLYWGYRYFILLGFLDGRAGFVFHFLQGFWYRLLVDAKLFEARLNAQRPRKL
jgi:glycosyltransferase involved in cell wall biosynthesis